MIRANHIVSRPVLSENTPPSVVKSLKRVRNTSGVGIRRRHLGMLSNTTLRSSQYLAEQAKKKNHLKEKSFDKQCVTPSRPSHSRVHRPAEPSLSDDDHITFTLTRVQAQAGDVQMVDAPKDSVKVRLPRRLNRPPPTEISKEALAAIIDPRHPAPPPQYLRDKMICVTPEMLGVVRHSRPDYDSRHLGEELVVKLPHPAVIPPTHVLAVQSNQPQPQDQTKKIKLFPAHSIVLGAHCAKLPPFEPVKEIPVVDCTVTIPTRTISVPSPQHFAPIITYIYTKQKAPLLKSLLGGVPQSLDDPAALAAFGTNMGRRLTVEALMETVLRIHAVWSNACSLGVVDNGFWDTLDIAWGILLTAMSVAVGEPHLMLASCSAAPSESRAFTSPPRPSADLAHTWHSPTTVTA